MSVLGVEDLVAERISLLDMIASLTNEEFESGRTLCAGWAPRDVLAHVIGADDTGLYLRYAGRVKAANNTAVERSRSLPRDDLFARAQAWTSNPAPASKLIARYLIGDVAMHHQDVLRGLGRTREIPLVAAKAIFREGVVLSTGTKRNLLRHRVVPTTPGGVALGRGRTVRGTTEALGLWLAGRKGIEAELSFDQ